MKEIKITEHIFMFVFDNETDFFRKVEGSDSFAITDKVNFEDALNKHKSIFSMIEESIIGKNSIENNKDKILQEFKELSIDFKWIIIRYVLPKVEYIYDTQPRIVGWSYQTNKS